MEAEDEIDAQSGEIICVTKQVGLSPDLPTFDEEFYRWKKEFWKERIKPVRHVLAPMVDQSELAFRMFLRERGAADLCFTPMIHAHLFVSDRTYRRGAFSTLRAASGAPAAAPTDRPLIVQFCANDARVLVDACRLVEGFCDGVDLNLGCPQLIAKRGRYGAFLQEFPELVTEMVRAVFSHCRLPISVKIRALATVDATVAYARALVAAGASMLSVHGRRREQRGVLTGLADWAPIAAVKRAVDVPVIANGNIQLFGDVERCLRATGADAVMSAEGVLSNPLLFAGRNSCAFDVARDYLRFAARYNANVSAIRAHVFRMCHHSLLKHSDLRERTSYVFATAEFRAIVDELERRCVAAEFGDDALASIDALASTTALASTAAAQREEITAEARREHFAKLLALDDSCRKRLAGVSSNDNNSNLVNEEGETLPSCTRASSQDDYDYYKTESLLDLINSTPYWVCKPYVRPAPPSKDHQQQQQQLLAENDDAGETPNENNNDAGEPSAYRAARNAEMARLSEATGLSRRQLRKRERRRVEAQRKAYVAATGDAGDGVKARRYPPCERCAQPAGANCPRQLCRRCCRLTCIRMACDCKVHGFSHEKMHEKRVAYAQRLGLTLDELLEKEVRESERQKFLKNAKKTPLDFNVLRKNEAEKQRQNTANQFKSAPRTTENAVEKERKSAEDFGDSGMEKKCVEEEPPELGDEVDAKRAKKFDIAT